MKSSFLTIILITLLSLTGCGDSPKPTALDKVTVQLKYLHQAQFAGLYWAIEKGYFLDENIEVSFIEGGRGIDLVTPVVKGDAQFGIASSDLILAKRVLGQPVKAIAAIYRRSAVTFVSKVDSDILRPHDMVGKKIAVYSEIDKEYEFQLRAMIKKLNIDIQKLDLAVHDTKFEDFLTGEIDVTGAYITGGAMRLKAQGVELNYIWPSDYGIDFYSDTIFVSDSLIENNSDLVKRFLRATLKGWNETIRNGEEAVEITMKYAKIKDKNLQSAMMDAQHTLIYTGEDEIGWMTDRVWQRMNTILYEQGVIDKPLTDLNSVYTMQFLLDVYNKNQQELK